MKAFAELYAALDATTKTNEKIEALSSYFSRVPREDARNRLCMRPTRDGGESSAQAAEPTRIHSRMKPLIKVRAQIIE